MLPSFASHYYMNYLEVIEKNNINVAYERCKKSLLKYIQNEEEKDYIKYLINKYKMDSELIWTESLIIIQLDHYCIPVRSNAYLLWK